MSDDVDMILRRKMLELQRRLLSSKGGKEEGCGNEIVHADSSLFDDILHRCRIVLADFWAGWCAPCRIIEPIIEEIAEKYMPRIAVIKVNVDENPLLAAAYSVMSIPTIVLFYRGREARRFVGFSPGFQAAIEREIQRLLN